MRVSIDESLAWSRASIADEMSQAMMCTPRWVRWIVSKPVPAVTSRTRAPAGIIRPDAPTSVRAPIEPERVVHRNGCNGIVGCSNVDTPIIFFRMRFYPRQLSACLNLEVSGRSAAMNEDLDTTNRHTGHIPNAGQYDRPCAFRLPEVY